MLAGGLVFYCKRRQAIDALVKLIAANIVYFIPRVLSVYENIVKHLLTELH